MTTKVKLERVFKFGSIEFKDIAGINDPKDVVKMYENNYPELAFCELDNPVRNGDKLVYKIIKPTVKTKG